MVNAIEAGEIQGIICWSINRLVRNMEEGGKLSQLLIDGPLREIRTQGGVYRTGDNIMPLVIEAAAATQFSLDHSKAVRRGSEGSFRSGGCTHRAPQGYRNIRSPIDLKKGLVERDPDRFEVVRKAWDMLLTGNYSVAEITSTMNESWGYLTRATRKRGNTPLSPSALYSTFCNPFYAGFVRRKGEVVDGTHEPMVTVAEFDRAQVILSKSTFTRSRGKEYAYTGLMHCAYCGHQITAETKVLRSGALWENYRCSDYKLNCTKQGMSLERVERQLFAEIKRIQFHPEAISIAFKVLRRSVSRALDATDVGQAQASALQKSERRLLRLQDMWLNGLITDPEHYRNLEKEESKRRAELTLEKARIRERHLTAQANLKRAEGLLNELNRDIAGASDQVKKHLFQSIAESYSFDGRNKLIRIQIAPVLQEIASFIRNLGSIEPPETGSWIRKEPLPAGRILFGGQDSSPVELVPSLVTALLDGKLPEWNPGEEPLR